MTDKKKKGAKKSDAAAVAKSRKQGAAATSQPGGEVPRNAGDGEPPHGDPLRAVLPGVGTTGLGTTGLGTTGLGTTGVEAAGIEPGLESGRGAEPVSTGGAPDPMMPDVWAPAEPDGPPGTAPIEAGLPVEGHAAPVLPEDAPAGVTRAVAEDTYSESALSESALTDSTLADSTLAERTVAERAHVDGAPAVSRNTRTARVGLFVGREWSFPPAFVQAVERRDAGVQVEFAKIGAPRFDEPSGYDLCIDRISHEVPIYRSYLKQAALQGTTVVNNPFMWTADDKFFGAALADRLGVASPKTVVLPNREYVPGIVPSESLRNMEYPLDWQGIADYIGMPCVLKDAHGGGWKEVYICHSLEELIHHYNHSGLLTMIVQEFIQFEHFVRCLVIGREEVLPMKYDPKHRKYVVDHSHLTPELGTRIVGDARKLCNALGYDMNSMEFAIRDGVPYAIDFMNPAPDMDVNSLGPLYFEWVVEHMADMAVRLASEARDGARATREPSWGSVFGGAAARAPGGGR
jgi:hypothetical protein